MGTICWAAAWWQFGMWLIHVIHKHQSFLDRAPTYAGAAICLYIGGWAMLAAIGSAVADKETQNKSEPCQEAESISVEIKDRTAPSVAEVNLDPYCVLGLSKNATSAEIREAYHQLMSAYHPDKVEHLGDDIKAVAKRRTLEIQLAMERIRGSHI